MVSAPRFAYNPLHFSPFDVAVIVGPVLGGVLYLDAPHEIYIASSKQSFCTVLLMNRVRSSAAMFVVVGGWMELFLVLVWMDVFPPIQIASVASPFDLVSGPLDPLLPGIDSVLVPHSTPTPTLTRRFQHSRARVSKQHRRIGALP